MPLIRLGFIVSAASLPSKRQFQPPKPVTVGDFRGYRRIGTFSTRINPQGISTMGGWGSGRRRKPGHRPSVESSPALDIHHLLARGCLQPGWLGTCLEVSGDVAIDLRAGVGRLHISWRSVSDPVSNPGGDLASSPASDLASSPDSGPGGGLGSGASEEPSAGRTEIISISRVTYRSGARHLYFLCPGAGCGRRVLKLYLSQRRFLCRHCKGLVYTSKYERPWRQAFRRVNKLRQRLGVTGRKA
jgi:hypothetical protein